MPSVLPFAAPARRSDSRVTHGAAIVFETLGAGPAPVRIRPEEETLLRVVAGAVTLAMGEDERMLATGDEARIPAGAPHRILNATGEARVLLGFRASCD